MINKDDITKQKVYSCLMKMMLNKYFITVIGLILLITFVIEDSLVERFKAGAKIKNLKNKKEYYEKKIKESYREKEELLSSKENLEKFAREQYLMKKENEDIFLIIE